MPFEETYSRQITSWPTWIQTRIRFLRYISVYRKISIQNTKKKKTNSTNLFQRDKQSNKKLGKETIISKGQGLSYTRSGSRDFQKHPGQLNPHGAQASSSAWLVNRQAQQGVSPWLSLSKDVLLFAYTPLASAPPDKRGRWLLRPSPSCTCSAAKEGSKGSLLWPRNLL